MGSCMGRCVPCTDSTSRLFNRNIFSNSDGGPDFTNLIEESAENKRYNGLSQLCSVYSFALKASTIKPVLELVEGIFNPSGDSYSRLNESQRLPSNSSYNSRDISLQCLDARALMVRTATSTPASSVDLEWEHEALPPSITNDPSASSWATFGDDTACPTESSTQNARESNGNSDWSRVSSADSLEWDNVQGSLHVSPPSISDVDTDTQLLLSEIERLTSAALNETGQNLIS